MFIVILSRLFTWGSLQSEQLFGCRKCGYEGPMVRKSGINVLTLYWVVPLFPLGRVRQFLQCPRCKARYDAEGPGRPPAAGTSPWGERGGLAG